MVEQYVHPRECDLVLLCGPPAMIERACVPALKQLGVGSEKILVF